MRTRKILVLSSLMIAFFTLSSFESESVLHDNINSVEVQNGLVVYATYDGKEDYGYNFVTKDKDGEERTLTFQKIEEPALSLFDLNADTFVGTKFKVTFNKDIKVTKDENNMDDEEEVNTITHLEKL